MTEYTDKEVTEDLLDILGVEIERRVNQIVRESDLTVSRVSKQYGVSSSHARKILESLVDDGVVQKMWGVMPGENTTRGRLYIYRPIPQKLQQLKGRLQ